MRKKKLKNKPEKKNNEFIIYRFNVIINANRDNLRTRNTPQLENDDGKELYCEREGEFCYWDVFFLSN